MSTSPWYLLLVAGGSFVGGLLGAVTASRFFEWRERKRKVRY